MPYDGMRRVISSYDPLDPQEPPEYGLPPVDGGGGGIGVPPQTTTPRDNTQRATFRANRLRDFLAANPGRRAGMGRRADGTVAYDPSMWGSDWAGPAIGANNPAPRTVTAGGEIAAGAFNAANPATQPAAPTNRGPAPSIGKPNWSPNLLLPPRGYGGGGGI